MALAFFSNDGGLSYTPVIATGLESGSAWKAAAELDLGEWFGKADRYKVRLYYKELEPGFFSSGNFLEQGTEKVGLSASLALTGADSVQVRANREDRSGPASLLPGTPAQTTIGSVQWQRKKERWGVAVEYFSSESEDSAGNQLRESSFGAARWWTKVTDKLDTHVEHQQTLTGPENDQTTAGLQYQVLPSLALELTGTQGDLGSSAQAGAILTRGDSVVYLTERLTEDLTGVRKASTVLGAKSPIGPSSRVYTEYQWEDGENGNQTVSLLGLQRQWDVGPGFRVLLSGEAADVDSPSSATTSRSAVAASVSYANSAGLKAVTRNEMRYESGAMRRSQFFTFTQVDYSLNDDLTLLTRYRYSKTKDRDSEQTEAKLEERSIGVAYRPVSHDRFNSLARYTRLLDQRPAALGLPVGSDTTMDVVSIETAYRINPRLEWLSKNAYRIQEERLFDLQPVETDTYLGIVRFNYNVWKRFDIGQEYRLLSQDQTDDRRQGWLTELMWNVMKHFRVGVGYNFTDFSDNEFSQNDYSVHGWFVRLQGRY